MSFLARLPEVGSAGPARSWMAGGRPAPAPRPLFGGSAGVLLDEAEIARRLGGELAEARAAGERQGWDQAAADVAAAISRLGDAIGKIEETARAMARPCATELVELALIVARELVGAEMRRDPAPLIHLVERCLDDVAGESSITIRLHPADRAALVAARPELARAELRFLEDPTLARGGCAVESARRLVDARLEERLDKVRDGLRELLEEAEHADL